VHCLSIVQSIGLFAHYINRPILYTHTRRLKTDTFGYSSQVLFLYAHVDEFVMQHVRRHKGKDLVSVEVAELEDDADAKKEGDADGKSEGEGEALGEEAMEKLCQWFAEKALPGRVTGVKSSSRLRSSPALLVGHEPEAMRRYRLMLTMMQDDATATKLDDLQSAAGLELNPRRVHGAKCRV